MCNYSIDYDILCTVMIFILNSGLLREAGQDPSLLCHLVRPIYTCDRICLAVPVSPEFPIVVLLTDWPHTEDGLITSNQTAIHCLVCCCNSMKYM